MTPEAHNKIAATMEILEIGDELFWEPLRQVRPGPWTGHLATAFWLVKAARPRTFVELGTHSGNSYAAFCQAIALSGSPTQAFAVDTWQGDEHAGLFDESVFTDLNAFNEKHFATFSKLLRTTFDNARSYFADQSVDLLHIDGFHTYEVVKHDFETWQSAMSSRGVVVFHDINVREREFGVWKLWEELTARYPFFEFHHSEGLGILGLGESQTPLIARLFELGKDREQRALVQRIFAARGETFTSRARALELEHGLGGASEDLQKKADYISVLEEELVLRDTSLREQEKDRQVKDELVRRLTEEGNSKNEHIGEQDRRIGEQDRRIGEKERRIGEQEWKIGDLEQILASAREEVTASKRTTDQLLREKSEILNSRSWRLTGPLRSLKTRIPSLRLGRFRRARQLSRDKQLVADSGLFDLDLYLQRNSDVADANADPIEHYLMHGGFEGRDPSPSFSSQKYLDENPDVQAAGVNPLAHYLRHGRLEGRRAVWAEAPSDTDIDVDVFSYLSMPIDPRVLPRKVAIGVSSQGNFFMAEIARMIEDAFRQLGTATRLFDEHDAGEVSPGEMVLVVAPHEFFIFGNGPRLFEKFKRLPQLVMFNTEQPQTAWFTEAAKYLKSATAVLDINYESAQYFARSGHKSYFLPLGYSEYMVRAYDGAVLPEHELLEYMPASRLGPVPSSYSERPIDILFVGTSSPRRSEFLAANAKYFASKNALIYMPVGDKPFLPDSARTLEFPALVALVRRAKVLLNVHRDPHPYLEWQRIVTLGILQKTLVVSDHCDPGPCIQPNLDYLDGPLDSLPVLCELALSSMDVTESIANRAYERLKATYPTEQVVGRCFTAMAKSTGGDA